MLYKGDCLIELDRYETEHQAAMAYNRKAKELFGEYACLNAIFQPVLYKRIALKGVNYTDFQRAIESPSAVQSGAYF